MRGKVSVIAGYSREWEGRTELVLNIAREHISLGIPCIYFSLEYPSIFLKKKIEFFNEHSDFRMTDTRLLDLCDIPGISIEIIAKILDDYKNHNLTPVVIIDGVELISLGSGDIDYNARMKEALEAVRRLADSFDTSIFLTMTAKRQFEHRKNQWYSLSDIPFDDVCSYADSVLFSKCSDSDEKVGYIECQGNLAIDSSTAGNDGVIIDIEATHRQMMEIRLNQIKMSDEELTDRVTESLLTIAKNPKARKEYTVQIAPGINEYCTVNKPMISNFETLIKAKYKSACLVFESTENLDKIENDIMELIDKMSDSIDYCSALSFLNRKKYERYYLMNEFHLAKVSLLSALDYATNDNYGVDSFDIESLIDVLRKDASDSELLEWISDVSGHVKEQIKSYYSGEVEDENELGKILNECMEYADSKWEIVQDKPSFRNLVWLPYAIMQVYGVVDHRQRRSPKKNSFDWHYSQAEKGNKDSQHFISEAFKSGNGVTKNNTLATYWHKVAKQ